MKGLPHRTLYLGMSRTYDFIALYYYLMVRTMEYGTHSCGYGVLLDIVTTPLFHEDGLDCDTVR